MKDNSFYGESIWNTEIATHKWVLSWKFPFIKKMTFWDTPINLRKELNSMYRKLLDQSPPKKKSGEIETNVPIHGAKKGKG